MTSRQSHAALKLVPLAFSPIDEAQMRERAVRFHDEMARRRTVRDYSPRPVPREVIESAIRTAGTAPSGANLQPWHFVAIGAGDRALRKEIRDGAEVEEREFYERRAPQEWLDALAPLGNRLAQTVSRGRTVAHRGLRSAARSGGRRPRAEALLRGRIGRDRDRVSHRRAAPRGTGDADPYAEPHGVPQPAPRPSGARAAIPAARRRLSRRRRASARHQPQAARRDRELALSRPRDSDLRQACTPAPSAKSWTPAIPWRRCATSSRWRATTPRASSISTAIRLASCRRQAAARVAEVVNHEWGEGLIRSWNSAGWITLAQRIGDKIAPLIGAGPGEVIVADSTSVNLYKVLMAAMAVLPASPSRCAHRLGANEFSDRPLHRRQCCPRDQGASSC